MDGNTAGQLVDEGWHSGNLVCEEWSAIWQKHALRAIYKCKVAEDEPNEAALVAADGWNGQVQTLTGENIDPDRHNEE